MTTEYSYLRDVFGNMPMLKRYSLLSLFFLLNNPASISEIETSIQRGLDKLSTAIPHLKGHVVFEGQSESNWGRRQIFPLDDHICLSVKDLRKDDFFPSMEQLKNARYPFSMLDEGTLVPSENLPPSYTSAEPYKETTSRPARVIVVQAVFIRGGLVLTFCSNHTTMDMNGLGQTICLFAKACREEPFTDEEIEQANQNRSDAVPLLGAEYQPGPEAKYFMFKPNEQPSRNGSSCSPFVWAYIDFSGENLTRLKERASQQTIVPYITTNDALTAFFWQHITRARVPKMGRNVETEVNRQLSVRRILGLSDGYMGHMTGSTHNHEVDVFDQPIAEVTGKIRQALQDTDNIKFHVRAMATMLERAEDKRKIGPGASLDWERDVVLSSYAEIQCCQVSFGPLLGMADAARRPRASASPSVVYLMPKDSTGGMAAAVCLREDDMMRLRDDPEFCKYATYVG